MINVILQFLGLDLFNIKLSAKFYQNIPNGLRVKFHFFSEFEPRQNLDQSQMSFDNLMGYILSIQMCMQNFITIFHSVQEIGPFFQNLELGKTSTDEKCHFTISWARSCQYQCLCRSLWKIFHSVQEIRPFSLVQNLALDKVSTDVKYHFAIVSLFFRIWTSAKTQPISNVIWQSHGVHLVNINVYAKFHHNIPLRSRDSVIITFSEFGARQSLDQWKMTLAISWARSCQYQCLRNSLSKYSTQFKR